MAGAGLPTARESATRNGELDGADCAGACNLAPGAIDPRWWRVPNGCGARTPDRSFQYNLTAVGTRRSDSLGTPAPTRCARRNTQYDAAPG